MCTNQTKRNFCCCKLIIYISFVFVIFPKYVVLLSIFHFFFFSIYSNHLDKLIPIHHPSKSITHSLFFPISHSRERCPYIIFFLLLYRHSSFQLQKKKTIFCPSFFLLGTFNCCTFLFTKLHQCIINLLYNFTSSIRFGIFTSFLVVSDLFFDPHVCFAQTITNLDLWFPT